MDKNRRIYLAIVLVFFLAWSGGVVRDLFRGTTQQAAARRQIGKVIRKDENPQAYWENIALKAGSGVVVCGLFYWMARFIRPRQKPQDPREGAPPRV